MENKIKKELLDAYLYQKALLNSYKTLAKETRETEQELKVLKKRYNALSNSKLGKLQLKYWTRRNAK